MAAPAFRSKDTSVDDQSSVKHEIPSAGPSDSFILGVQIACPYDIHRSPQPRFSVYPTPTADFQSRRQPSAPLMSARIKIPLALHISNTDRTNFQYANYHAENLMRVGYTEIAEWGKIPRHVRNPGTMLVFRQDGKPLLPQHVEAFCAWLSVIFATWMPENSHCWAATEFQTAQKERFNRIATKEQFEKFWEWWKGQEERSKNLPSPYEV
ncbi:MAG: hypothetical protein Q9201_006725 [Fulgogasparrea decipioides]